ncbi:hypothetical protein Hanom_Chr02g00121031 [Helianthus anomalus]
MKNLRSLLGWKCFGGNREREKQNMRGHICIFGSGIYETRQLETLMNVRVPPPVTQGIQLGYDDEWVTILIMNYKSIVVLKLTDEETLLGDVESDDEEDEIERKGEDGEELSSHLVKIRYMGK